MKANEQGIPVLINLASVASYEGMTDEPMQVITTGVLYQRENCYQLQYRENQEDEQDGSVMESEICLVLKKDQVTMNRMGEYSNTMLFQKNKRFETDYRTPFGNLPMAVYARNVQCELGSRKGKVHLVYELSMQGSYASTNELHLEYWAQ